MMKSKLLVFISFDDRSYSVSIQTTYDYLGDKLKVKLSLWFPLVHVGYRKTQRPGHNFAEYNFWQLLHQTSPTKGGIDLFILTGILN